MIFIPRPIIAAATFPGVIVHEVVHQLVCRITCTPVLNVCYFQVAAPAGYVIHDEPSDGWKQLLISLAPFVVNSTLAVLICLPVAMAETAKAETGALDIFLGWVGMSVGMNAFPNFADAASLWEAVKKKDASWLMKITATPVVGWSYAVAALSLFWFDALYAGLLCFGLPLLVLEAIV
ncbi:metalloprotease family protein [Prosthecobacter sp.]|uniref:metalloprotease family protein n=1 Tax=Prosthecobacter sp. TaxID=1965333 RepID=UPI0037838DF0